MSGDMSKKLNGFNNGRDRTEGVGGKPPIDLDRIKSKKNDVMDALEQEKHSFARSQAIEFAEWCFDGDNPYINNFVTSDLYDLFLDRQAKQSKT